MQNASSRSSRARGDRDVRGGARLVGERTGHAGPERDAWGSLLTYKIFYYHVPVGDGDVPGRASSAAWPARCTCSAASAAADRLAVAAAELTVVFGLIVLVTGPLWARKAWGVWWQWDARLTSTLLMWMIFVAYLLVRRFGGPGSEKLSAAMALFGMANVPFVYVSVNIWRTMHPTTRVVPTLGPGMRGPFWFCVLASSILFALLLAVRARLEQRRAEVEHLHLLADEDEWTIWTRRSARGDADRIPDGDSGVRPRRVGGASGRRTFAGSAGRGVTGGRRPTVGIRASVGTAAARDVAGRAPSDWRVRLRLGGAARVRVVGLAAAAARRARSPRPVRQACNAAEVLAVGGHSQWGSRMADMGAGHFIYIPAVLLLGIVLGWIFGSRAARDAFAAELRRREEREAKKHAH